jgi:FixJ family two-component response regulator
MCDAKDCQRNPYRFYSPELEFKSERDELRRAEIENRLTSLTPREREVQDILIAGKAYKMFVYLLGASTRAIENHRARIMDKNAGEFAARAGAHGTRHHRSAPPAA